MFNLLVYHIGDQRGCASKSRHDFGNDYVQYCLQKRLTLPFADQNGSLRSPSHTEGRTRASGVLSTREGPVREVFMLHERVPPQAVLLSTLVKTGRDEERHADCRFAVPWREKDIKGIVFRGGILMLGGLFWLRDQGRPYCITFARGLDETELLRRFGGKLSWAHWAQVDAYVETGDVLQVGRCEGWTFAYEYNGYYGTFPEVLRTVSLGTVAITVYESINATLRFCSAEDGVMIADLDPLDLPFEEASPRVRALLDLAGVTPERAWSKTYDPVEALFALAEASGVRLDQEMIAEKLLLTSRIVSLPEAE